MKRIFILFTVLLLLGLAGCGSESMTEDGTTEVTTTAEQKEESFTGSMKDLMAKAVPMKCSWSFYSEGMVSEGDVWVHGKKYRSDVKADEIDMHALSDGTYMYSWSSMQSEGTKIKLSAIEEMADEYEGDVETTKAEYADMDSEYDYKCSPWVPTSSKFVPPSDITFQDMTAMMEQMQQMADKLEAGGSLSEQDMCAMCGSIPDAKAKADCLANC